MDGAALWENIKKLPIESDHNILAPKVLNSLKTANLPESIIDFTAAVAECSPYLHGLMQHQADYAAIFKQSPESYCDLILKTMADYKDMVRPFASTESLMVELRMNKQKLALGLGLADLGGLLTLEQVTHYLSKFADHALDLALIYSLQSCLRLKDRTSPFPHQDQTIKAQCGLFPITILAMGKLGADELNYSSDIDLILLYDPQGFEFCDPDRLQQDLVRTSHLFTKIIEEKQANGYVFRVDLRLRPDPNVTPPIISVEAAEQYYETQGLNWERSAMIKARPCAGNIELGNLFLTHIKPFIWRKYLDFAAIEDIRAIKLQIEAYRKGKEIDFFGHNIKTGHGGIREIEFYAQTQQLIWGGKQSELRIRQTIASLHQLSTTKIIKTNDDQDLKMAYVFLRTLEHRLQMVDDQQTQTMPNDRSAMLKIANMMGFESIDAFEFEFMTILGKVAAIFDDYFFKEDEQDHAISESLDFSHKEIPIAIESFLRDCGFKEPTSIYNMLHIWAIGRYRATKFQRARDILKKILPELLVNFKSTLDPDAGFRNFDRFLEKLPSGVQLFSLFKSNPNLMRLLIDIISNAPRLGQLLSDDAELIENLLDQQMVTNHETIDILRDKLTDQLNNATIPDDDENIFYLIRKFVSDREFQIGVQFLQQLINIDELSLRLSNLAEASVGILTEFIIGQFIKQHGTIETSNFAIIAVGKLGSRELLPASDLDLLLVYDEINDDEAQIVKSNGQRPLYLQVYYQRLAQRIVNGISLEMRGGKLFEVDLRLRPSGTTALANQFQTLIDYYMLESGKPKPAAAWNFEYMAMTRARVIYATNTDFKHSLCKWRNGLFQQERDTIQLAIDVKDMR
ncbi:MAG: bifunctional [glutamine synthetase] adenylyltransferase/[glutamine synthetase]-adenylyl-L-tyrosine phosphorylase, partial [Alphaproteobacteria bacterium]